jgi:hypothetical protein
MKLEKVKNPQKYQDLYVFDFGEYSSVGFTAQEVAELFESEKYKKGKAYRIHRANPDGTLELQGVDKELFALESGMFFYCDNEFTCRKNFKALISLAVSDSPPCNVKVHLVKYSKDKFAAACIYPAEYDNQISKWLLENNFKTNGQIVGGVNSVNRYYNSKCEIIEKHQLFGRTDDISRTADRLFSNLKEAVQR